MTQTVETTTRTHLIEMIRSALKKAEGQQLGPTVLVNGVARDASSKGVRATRDAVELAMFAILKDGEAVWTKEGPVRLQAGYIPAKKGNKAGSIRTKSVEAHPVKVLPQRAE